MLLSVNIVNDDAVTIKHDRNLEMIAYRLLAPRSLINFSSQNGSSSVFTSASSISLDTEGLVLTFLKSKANAMKKGINAIFLASRQFKIDRTLMISTFCDP